MLMEKLTEDQKKVVMVVHTSYHKAVLEQLMVTFPDMTREQRVAFGMGFSRKATKWFAKGLEEQKLYADD